MNGLSHGVRDTLAHCNLSRTVAWEVLWVRIFFAANRALRSSLSAVITLFESLDPEAGSQEPTSSRRRIDESRTVASRFDCRWANGDGRICNRHLRRCPCSSGRMANSLLTLSSAAKAWLWPRSTRLIAPVDQKPAVSRPPAASRVDSEPTRRERLKELPSAARGISLRYAAKCLIFDHDKSSRGNSWQEWRPFGPTTHSTFGG